MNIVEVLIRTKEMGMAAAEKEAESFGARIKKAGMIGGAALLAVGVESVRMAAKFDSSMTLLETQAGVTHSKMLVLKKGIIDLAGVVGFDPNSLAQSAFHVASNFESMGATAPKMLAIVKTAAEGARIGQADLVDVTNALGAALASKIPGVKNFGQAMGALNAIVGTGDMHMQDLAEALGTGMLAVVKGFGLSLNDVGAALATFGDNNIRGALAASQLRMAVQALAVPAKAGQDQLAAWGLSVNTFATDMRKGGLLPALEHLQTLLRMHGVGPKEQGDILTQMFGKRAGTGLNVLMDQLDRVKSKYPELTKGAHDFGKAWTTTQGTLTQQLHQLNGSFSALMVTIGEKLIPVVMKVVSWLNKHKSAALIILGVAAAFAVLTVAVAALNVVMDANPISLIIIALAAVVAGLIYAYNHFKRFREIVDGVFKNVAHAAGNLWHALENVWHAVTNVWHAGSNLFNALQNVWHAASNVWHAMTNVWHALSNVWNAAQNVWHAADNVFHAFGNLFHAAGNVFHAMGNVAHAIGNVAHAIGNVVNAIQDAIGWFGRLAGAANSALGGIPGKVLGFLGLETGGIVGAATGGVQGGLRMVGERGPELVRLPRGSMVYPHGQSAGMMGGSGGRTVVEFRLPRGSSKFDQFMVDWLRRAIQDYGGGDVQQAFGAG